MKTLRSALGVVALVALGVGIGVLYMVLRTEPLVPAQDAAVAGVPADTVDVTLREDAGRYLDVRPAQGEADTLFVLYPGGLVRPQAYTWLGVALAPSGVRTVIPEMPLDLALLAPAWVEEIAPSRPLILGGHSLGGAMAARYALNNAQNVDGLVLLASYPAESDDLSALGFDTLVLAAEHDGLATLSEIRARLPRLPNPELVEIDGAVHSFFGRYGPQQGDGIPTVTRAQAEAEIVRVLQEYIDALDIDTDIDTVDED